MFGISSPDFGECAMNNPCKEANVTTFYGTDLAAIHNAGFDHFAQHAAGVVRTLLQQQDQAAGLIVDLGCGSGITADILVQAGYDVLGIDLSSDLITLARERVPQATFLVSSLLDVAIPACVAVTAIGECLNYAFDPSNTADKRLSLFQRIAHALPQGGILLFDVAEPGRVGAQPLRTYTEGEGWAVLMTAEEDGQAQRLTRQITTFRRVGDLYRRDHEVHQLHLLERATLMQQLQEVGFQVEILDHYGHLAFGPGHSGFLARKEQRNVC